MNSNLWIGFGFLTALLVFLFVTFFRFETLSADRRNQLKFLTALCAAMAGGFISGGAVFDASWTTAIGKVALSGTAGFALFWGVFYLYDRTFMPDDACEFDIPAGATFRQSVEAVAQFTNAAVDFQGFASHELASPMMAGHIRSKTIAQLITILRLKTITPGAVKEYTVTKGDGVYRVKAN